MNPLGHGIDRLRRLKHWVGREWIPNRLVRYPRHVYRVKDTWFWNVFEEGWEPQTFKVFADLLGPATVYVDIGAYIGPTALLAADCGCRKIFCVEASPINFKFLKKNLRLNKWRIPPYQADHLCVSDAGGVKVRFGGGDLSTANSMRGDRWDVDAVTLAGYIAAKRIPLDDIFLKVDVEGAEQLLAGDLLGLLDRAGKGVCFLSVHPPFIDDKERFAGIMEGAFERFEVLDSDCRPLSSKVFRQRMMSPDEHPAWGTPFGNFFEIVLRTR